jgi:pimeloyl-ACP methyl ester carboxylesterase
MPLEEVRVPVLAIANRFTRVPWYDMLDPADRDRADRAVAPVVQAQTEAWERYTQQSGAKRIDLPDSNHHVYLANAQEVFEAILAFLLSPADTLRRRDANGRHR